MAVYKTKGGRWFVNYYRLGERKKAKRKYFGRGRESELALRQWGLDRAQAGKEGRFETFEARIAGMTFLELTHALAN